MKAGNGKLGPLRPDASHLANCVEIAMRVLSIASVTGLNEVLLQ